MRVNPSSLAARSIVVSTRVPRKPPAREDQRTVTALRGRRRLRFGNGERCVDERQMHERLREISEEVAGVRIDLLRIEADVVGLRGESVHELGGLAQASRAGKRGNEPERTIEEA